MIPNNNVDPALSESEVQHLPDIQFVNYCYQTFGLNRGIYNTIDQWLYDFGFRDIVGRRELTIAFLNDVQKKNGKERTGTILRFGKGGLTKQLYDFIHFPQRIFFKD
ncbi:MULTISPECIES: RNA-binding protein [unclassified Paenibacillus]|uniref:RNA-binding protein n=1 Tax=unclassified Paenibacillus TaxID=185978 RepID=UPI00363F1E5B